MRVSIGADHRGYQLKAKLGVLLGKLGHQVIDEGADENQSVDYPDIAAAVAGKVSAGEADRGVLICGTGIGMAISANKIPGVRAATCHDAATAEMSRRHNDVNVLCLSGDALSQQQMEPLVKLWLTTEFEGGRHERRVRKIGDLEQSANPCSSDAETAD